MDWRDVAKVVAPLAPALGSILGGFIPIPGGSLIGQTLGNVIAKQFGVAPTPEAVSKAIIESESNVAVAKLNAAVEQAKAEIDGFTRVYEAETQRIVASTQAVNETMRVEVQNQHWFYTGWRPACGWTFWLMVSAFGVILLGATLLAIGGDDKALKVMTEAWPIYLAYFGTLAAMVGVYVVGRSTEKAALTKTTPVVVTKR